MRKIAGLVCLLLISGVGCGHQDDKSAAAPDAATPEVTAPGSTVGSNSAAQPAAANEDKSIVAGESVDSAEAPVTPETSASETGNIQLAQAVAAPAPAIPARWQRGVHYRVLVPAQPVDSSPDKVEVTEVFWYGCAHCYGLEPYIENWLSKKKPAYVQFRRLPVIWGPVHRMHARLFYTLQSLKREDLHPAVFREVQVARNPLASENAADSEQMHQQFAKRQGIDAEAFRKAYHSFDVETKLQRAEQLVRGYEAATVPLIVVNGKYVTDIDSAGNPSRLIELINDLAASEQKK